MPETSRVLYMGAVLVAVGIYTVVFMAALGRYYAEDARIRMQKTLQQNPLMHEDLQLYRQQLEAQQQAQQLREQEIQLLEKQAQKLQHQIENMKKDGADQKQQKQHSNQQEQRDPAMKYVKFEAYTEGEYMDVEENNVNNDYYYYYYDEENETHTDLKEDVDQN